MLPKATVLLASIIAIGTLTTDALACECDGQFVLKSSIGERRVPTQAFEAHHRKGNLQTHNQCRRDARDDAHACMNAIWQSRFSPGSLPGQCIGKLSDGGDRFRGAPLPTFIKRDIERAVCCQPSDLGDQHDSVVEVFTRTAGGRGCGPNLQESTSRKLTNYRVDCLAVRDRENREGRFCGRIARTFNVQRYDRPGSNLLRLAGSSSWQSCRSSCESRADVNDPERRCRSWTWVPPDHEFGGCWLKNTIPWAQPIELPGIDQMVSGTVENSS